MSQSKKVRRLNDSSNKTKGKGLVTCAANFVLDTLRSFGYLILLGDLHIGHPTFDQEAFLLAMSNIKTDAKQGIKCIVILMGDLLDYVMTSHKFSNAEERDNRLESITDAEIWLIDQLTDLKNTPGVLLLGSHVGNHELRGNKEGINVIHGICHQLGIIELGRMADIRLNIWHNNKIINVVRMLTRHNITTSSTNSMAVMRSALKTLDENEFVVDSSGAFVPVTLVAGGHSHYTKVWEEPTQYRNPDTGQFMDCVRWVAQTGHFCQVGYNTASYAMDKNYKPLPTGYVVFKFNRNGIIEGKPVRNGQLDPNREHFTLKKSSLIEVKSIPSMSI